MQIQELKSKHQDETVLILGTGPSLNQYSPEQLISIAKGKVCFALKQAYSYCPSIANYHFLNSANIQPYQYAKPIPIILSLAANEGGWTKSIPHHTLLVVGDNTNFDDSLSATHALEKWSLDNTLERPWGPGLFWECVLYSAEYMGFKNIETIGVDLGPAGETTRDHFYGEGFRVNPLSNEETSNEIELSKAFYHWLSSKGIEWKVLSEKSYLHQDIPRWRPT